MIRRAWGAFVAFPDDPPVAADRRTVSLVGLELPVRATVAILVVTAAVLLDYSRTFIPADVQVLGRAPAALRVIAFERLLVFGLVPLAVVLLAFRDRPARYGISLGDWRWGAALTVAGCLVMTPIVLWFATLPDVRAYYGPGASSVLDIALTNGVELTAAEFAFRGFLTFVLIRTIGPLGLVVAALPFVFGHLGKPALEVFSTLGGGLVYGWLAWRTRSIVWGALGHTYIVTLVTLAAIA